MQVRDPDGLRQVNIEVVPIRVPIFGERCFLVLFEDSAPPRDGNEDGGAQAEAPRPGPQAEDLAPESVEEEASRVRQEVSADLP